MIASLQAQVTVLSLQLSAIQAQQLQVRINGVLQPCARISFDSANLNTVYTASVDHCHVWSHYHDASGNIVGVPSDPPS